MSEVRVRFPPSPTGYLHIGGARTAILNWLYARKHKGKFILRIEDTDAERSTKESIAGILDGLTWLGIDWDEGPYFQTDFTSDHIAAAEKMIANGQAYRCFCTKEELESKREATLAAKQSLKYDGTCRNLTPEQIAAKEARGLTSVIRFKVPDRDGVVAYEDKVLGRIERRFVDIEDFIIVRSNGKPLYLLCNVVDDIRDRITHIIRGQDHLTNTTRQVLLYEALNAPIPSSSTGQKASSPGPWSIFWCCWAGPRAMTGRSSPKKNSSRPLPWSGSTNHTPSSITARTTRSFSPIPRRSISMPTICAPCPLQKSAPW
jgi:glutamyl-tRNA synthetase